VRGWALAERGQREEGIAQINQGTGLLRAIGAELTQPYCLALAAEACGDGPSEERQRILTEALTIVSEKEERWWEAELHRLRGEFFLYSRNDNEGQSEGAGVAQSVTSKLEAQTEAEGCFLRALNVARNQQAKSLELRAAKSLSRLWYEQGKKKEAHDLLANVYSWFSEGFDTRDLREAKQLLGQLT